MMETPLITELFPLILTTRQRHSSYNEIKSVHTFCTKLFPKSFGPPVTQGMKDHWSEISKDN